MANWNNGFTSIKRKGQTFAQWCRDNNLTYMLDELDENYLRSEFGLFSKESLNRGFDKKVRWVCEKGHEFFAKPVHRTNGQVLTCPYCRRSRLSTLDHSVSRDMPHLVPEWDLEKNFFSPDDVVSADRMKVWWKCPKGHSYDMSPVHRREGKGCPYCANKRVLAGYNDLATTHPELAVEWDEERNKIPATAITYGNDKKWWWVCPNGHHYMASVVNRSYHKNGCPYCSEAVHTSFAEQAIYYYLSYLFYNVLSRQKICNLEYDVVLRDEKILVEFNGEHWHEGKESSDNFKRWIAAREGYRLIVVKAGRTNKETVVKGTKSYTEISCFAEKYDKSSIDSMVRSVIQAVFKFLDLPCPDLSFVDSVRDEEVLEKLYRKKLFLDTSEPEVGDETRRP